MSRRSQTLLLAVAVMLASALAGCTGSSGDAPTTAPTAPPTLTVKTTYTLALAAATNGRLSKSPAKTSYTSGERVTVTATRFADYELSSWGGACAGTSPESTSCTLTMDGDKTVSATFDPPLRLLLVTDGSTDKLKLEWTGGARNAAKWQYRENQRVLEPWGAWKDLPGSSATTRSYTWTGLTHTRGYGFQVRAVVGTTPGVTSNSVHGVTRVPGEYPMLTPDVYAEGDGVTEWRVHGLGVVLTIPQGARARAGYPREYAGGEPAVSVDFYPGGGSMMFNVYGRVLSKSVWVPTDTPNAASIRRDSAALLDTIFASLRKVEPLGPDR